jgi:Periplasmic glycine betaine/choline-binding (lipo)protein of an ABC-type transport system (osmoprotectant binding protein)
MRKIRSAALGAAMLALVFSACAPGGSSATNLAGTLVLGGPPECPTRPFCAKGLTDVYGITFKEFKALDTGGPITVQALKDARIDVGLLFTSDPAIAANAFVLLQDDKHLELADNIVPVIRQSLVDAHPEVQGLLDAISAKLTQSELTNLNKSVGVDGVDPKDAATAWLTANGFLPGKGGASPPVGAVKVGAFDFPESETLGELYAQVLEANGYTVERKFPTGKREIVYPAFQGGDIDFIVEYAASALEFVNKGAGEATTDVTTTVAALTTRLKDLGLAVLQPASATDQNGFVVTKATADKYSLTKISDLAKPAP